MTVNKNIARLAEGIKARREANTPDPATQEPSALDVLRSLVHADSDPNTALARLAKQNGHTGATRLDGITIGHTTTEKEA